ncbi:hypothetical protein CYMTET_43007 [Cymbomonas tetramitiformis]|uniref:Anoctamin transmembrane domain-containing protein n=1 Tax=Cymbomonas tetramitiformis TaxID=36881 RepID=A0AAE0C318_9CHLO|nr:hypothetical protein CYMTET_43007 [Cymbomonas tetramitiformis]
MAFSRRTTTLRSICPMGKAYPTLIALMIINNIIEIRVDAIKLVFHTRMPPPTAGYASTYWQRIFQFVALAGVLTTVSTLFYTCNNGPCPCTWSLPALECNDEPDEIDRKVTVPPIEDLFPNATERERLMLAFGIEHVVIMIQLCFTAFTSRTGEEVIADQFRQEFFNFRENEYYRSDDKKSKV